MASEARPSLRVWVLLYSLWICINKTSSFYSAAPYMHVPVCVCCCYLSKTSLRLLSLVVPSLYSLLCGAYFSERTVFHSTTNTCCCCFLAVKPRRGREALFCCCLFLLVKRAVLLCFRLPFVCCFLLSPGSAALFSSLPLSLLSAVVFPSSSSRVSSRCCAVPAAAAAAAGFFSAQQHDADIHAAAAGQQQPCWRGV